MNRKVYILCICVFLFLNNVFCQKYSTPDSKAYRILVLDFTCDIDSSSSKDGEYLANSIRAKLSNNTVNTHINIIDRGEMHKLFQDRSNGMKQSSLFDESTAIKLGKQLYANYVVLGQIYSSKSLFREDKIYAKIVEVETGCIKNALELEFVRENYKSIVDSIALSLTSIIPEQYFAKPMELSEMYDPFIKEMKLVSDSYRTYIKKGLFKKKNTLIHPMIDVTKTVFLSANIDEELADDACMLIVNEDGMFIKYIGYYSDHFSDNEFDGVYWKDLILFSEKFKEIDRIDTKKDSIMLIFIDTAEIKQKVGIYKGLTYSDLIYLEKMGLKKEFENFKKNIMGTELVEISNSIDRIKQDEFLNTIFQQYMIIVNRYEKLILLGIYKTKYGDAGGFYG
ncbi:MAG: hypothetical protein GQ564_23355 [Bacteroidales bacterium]|nr:hypothetical protein [Bacteroidales bacterium]